MATYRKRLTDEDGNTIIPAVGDVYGQVYTASISSSDSTTVTYEFTPECGLMTNSVYAVKFPTPTANLTKTLLLTDGNITAASILLPPPSATYQPSYTLATPSNINDTEPWLVMYNGTQWVCLNNKAKEEKEYYNSEVTNYGYPTAYTNTLSYTTLSAGKFLAIASGVQTATANNTFYQRLIQTRGGSTVTYTARYSSGITSLTWNTFAVQYVFDCQAGDVISIQRQASTAVGADGNNRTTLTIVKIN
jgi:hypothetical protein